MVFLIKMHDPPGALWLLLKLLTNLKPSIFKTSSWTSDNQCLVKHRIFIFECSVASIMAISNNLLLKLWTLWWSNLISYALEVIALFVSLWRSRVVVKFTSPLTLADWLTVNTGVTLSTKNPGFLVLAFFFVVWWVESEWSLQHLHFSCWVTQLSPVFLLLAIPLSLWKVGIEELSLRCTWLYGTRVHLDQRMRCHLSNTDWWETSFLFWENFWPL